jgi:2,3-bisphosphoglycerate-dependent phosphoglycerate mutase
MKSLVLMRHGQSEWNSDGRFAGWMDVDLTSTGIEQARRAGAFMRQQGLEFDRCYTSVLQRATHTARHCLDAMGRRDIPTETHWRLNERHYGALHGLGKEAVARAFGAAQLQLWRRGYATRPPPARTTDNETFRRDPRYAGVQVPDSESQADTVARVLPFWKDVLQPALGDGTRALVVAHGTSLRALVRLVCGTSEFEMETREFPNGVPFVIDFGPDDRAIPPYSLYE